MFKNGGRLCCPTCNPILRTCLTRGGRRRTSCTSWETLRGSRGREGPVHLLSAFASQARWVLAQCAVEGKSNEIKAIPKLLEMLDLEGATVTVDAIGCQKTLAEQVIEQGADYVLALKD